MNVPQAQIASLETSTGRKVGSVFNLERLASGSILDRIVNRIRSITEVW